MPYEGPAGPAMLEAAPVNVRVTPVESAQAGSTATVSPDSSTPFRSELPPACASTTSAAAVGRDGVCVGVGGGVDVAVGVGVGLGVNVDVGVGVLVAVGVGVFVGVGVAVFDGVLVGVLVGVGV